MCAENQVALQEGFEGRDSNSHNLIQDHVEVNEQWLSRQWQSWFKCHQRRGAIVHIHGLIRINSGNNELCNFCAFFETFTLHQSFKSDNRHVAPRKVILHHVLGDEVQCPMFVNSFEFVENPKGMLAIVRAQQLRLNSLDQIRRMRINASDSSVFLPCVHWTLPEDRELALASSLVREGTGVFCGEFVDQMVESTSEIVEEIPQDQPAFNGGEILNRIIGKDVASALANNLFLVLESTKWTARMEPVPFFDLRVVRLQVLPCFS